MWENLKDIFYFSRGEKNGILILLAILVILIGLPYINSIFTNAEEHLNTEFEQEIIAFTESLKEVEKPNYTNRLNQYIIERYDSLELFHFNPNNTSRKEFKKLGLTEKQINTIFNYTQKGGRFIVRDDFRKIYGIRHKQYEILKPYILLPEKKYISKANKYKTNYHTTKTDSLFVFDPNIATISELKKLGLSEAQAKTIVNYRNKGGIFKVKEDFRKIYTIPETIQNKLEPYILIKSTVDSTVGKTQNDNIETLELNTATISKLVKIKGIGNYTAQLIIRYRDKLGGFVKVKQLREIEKLNQNYFKQYKDQLKVNTNLVKKISINFAEVKDLSTHPYINFYQAKTIVEYRTKNGAYTDIKQLLDNKILLNTTYEKVKPYLKLN